MEKCRLWGATPEVLLKGQEKRPGAGKRKEARGEALGAELLRARRPKRATRGGRCRPTVAGRWRGQLPNTGKTPPEPNTPLSANCRRNPVDPPPLRAGAQAHAALNPGTLPTFWRQPDARGAHSATKLRPKTQMQRATQPQAPSRKSRHNRPYFLVS